MWRKNIRVSLHCQRLLSSEPSNAKKLKILKKENLQEGKFKSSRELAIELSQNILYYDPKKDSSGLIAINKPAGVAIQSREEEIGVEGALPELQAILKVKDLQLVKSVQRYASGCILLSTKDQGTNQIKKALRRASQDKVFTDTYYVLTHGLPRKDFIQETVDRKLQTIRNLESPLSKKGHAMEPFLDRILVSKSQLDKKENNIKRITVEASVISKSSNGTSSLFRVEATSVMNNFIPVYCADMLSPILGDEMFSYRVRQFMGKLVHVKPQLAPHQKTVNLPEWFLSKIGLSPGEEKLIPLHLHLGRVCLPKYFGKDKHLIINAPPRPFFQGTADMLGISLSKLEYDVEEWRTYKSVGQKKSKKSGPIIDILVPNEN